MFHENAVGGIHVIVKREKYCCKEWHSINLVKVIILEWLSFSQIHFLCTCFMFGNTKPDVCDAH